ncbi:MAG: phage tail protein [Kluyvera intermedia]
MSAKYRTVVTTAGAVKLAAAAVPGGKKVNLTVMAVGDGGGSLPEPNASQTKLVNEVWRHALNKISQDNKKKNYIVAELVIPPEVGGFWARELGLYDDAGTLIAVANMAESYKPELAEGSGRAQTCRMVIILSSIESVELSIDSTTVMATQDYVDDKITEHEQSRRHPDATLKEKGFVQLSSATDSTSEALAATPGAVKVAYDLANGKYSAQDATTARKGIVQLSSATNSESEVLAATPKAVKAANDNANGRVPSNRKVNGKELSSDITLSADDVDTVSASKGGKFKGVVDFNNIVRIDKNYPGLVLRDASAGDSLVGKDIILEASAGAVRLLYRKKDVTDNQLMLSFPKVTGTLYSTGNKPTAGDVDAVSAANGGTFQKEVNFNGGLSVRSATGIYGGSDAAGYTSNNMLLKSWFGIGFYCTLTDANKKEIGLTGYINTRSGRLEMKEQIIPGNYSNFDTRYQAKGNYTPAGQAYTKAESDARYVTDVQLGAGTSKTTWNTSGNWPKTAGYVITSVWKDASDYNLDGVVYAPLQKKIGNKWYTVSGGLA